MTSSTGRTGKVYVVMVADLFHYGHVEFLKKARSFGDYLIVGLLSDSRVIEYKRVPVMRLEERMRVVQACRYVDEVVVHERQRPAEWYREKGVVAWVHAIGTEADRERKAKRKPQPGLPPRYEVPYEPGVSTTAIIERIRQRVLSEVHSPDFPVGQAAGPGRTQD